MSENTDIKGIFRKNKGFLRTKGLTRNQWYQLKKLVDRGEVFKLKSGLYCIPKYGIKEQNREAAEIVPSGVFCLFSAWQHHNLSTQNPWQYHIAIEREEKVSLPDYPPIKIYRWSDSFYNLGIIKFGSIKIYDLEKSVCDAVRFRNKVGMDIAIEVVKNYVRRKKDRNLNKLAKYARQMRIETIMQNMTMPML
jgi:predicted transcriptional regulator of viral defense system